MVIRLEHIRQAMLDTLGDSIEDARCAITVRRIRFASDMWRCGTSAVT